MSWWPSRRVRRAPPPPPPDEMLVAEDRLRRNVEDVLVVRERQVHGAAVVFRGELMTEPARALDLLVDRFRPLGYMPYLRAEAGGVAVQALPLTQTVALPATRPNVILFSVTCITMLLAGLGYVGAPMFDAQRKPGRRAQPPCWRCSSFTSSATTSRRATTARRSACRTSCRRRRRFSATSCSGCRSASRSARSVPSS